MRECWLPNRIIKSLIFAFFVTPVLCIMTSKGEYFVVVKFWFCCFVFYFYPLLWKSYWYSLFQNSEPFVRKVFSLEAMFGVPQSPLSGLTTRTIAIYICFVRYSIDTPLLLSFPFTFQTLFFPQWKTCAVEEKIICFQFVISISHSPSIIIHLLWSSWWFFLTACLVRYP